MNTHVFARLIALSAVIGAVGSAAAEPLPKLNIDSGAVSVSGISSGAYMAGQFEVAFSETVMGVGVIAGGPYLCARYDWFNPVAGKYIRCMAGQNGGPQVRLLVRDVEVLAREGDIDPSGFISKHRVFLFSGAKDETVAPSVMDATFKFYNYFIRDPSAIDYVRNDQAPHAFITDNPKSQACNTACSGEADAKQCTYVNNCGYDTAGALLSHIYGEVEPLVNPVKAGVEPVRENLIAFDQGAYIDDPAAHSLAKDGHIYVPTACRDEKSGPCRLHVAFHGCQQSTARIGDAFTWEAGYNAWAEANRIVVLYPEVVPMTTQGRINPAGCWDWWGYDSPGEYFSHSGRQLAAVKRMVDALIGQ